VTYVKVCALDDIPDAGVLGVEVGEEPVALVRHGQEVHALRDVCSHAEVRLSEGDVYDGTLECWLHGSCFDVRTGKPTGPPATRPVPVYRVKIDGDDVLVSLDNDGDS
jgi:3-phenylpropionate/trans-cinnamate dioxygenase ferredoxin subunit